MNANKPRTQPALTRLAYATGALQGFAFSLIPALATVLTAAPDRLSDTAYGALFIPQTLFAVIGAFLVPMIARRYGTLTTMRVGFAGNIIALLALLLSTRFPRESYPLLLIDTTMLGFGFGLCNSAANEIADISSATPERSVTILNILTGLGTSLTPACVAILRMVHLPIFGGAAWHILPIGLAIGFLTMFVLVSRQRRATPSAQHDTVTHIPALLWIFTFAAILYGTCEGSFSNWATAFVQERGQSLVLGESALTGFWLSLTAMRVVATIFPKAFPPARAVPPAAIAAAIVFTLLPFFSSGGLLLAGFIGAGLSCGYMFPYIVANALAALPQAGARVSGYIVAGLMIGQGIGSFAIGALRPILTLAGTYRLAAVLAIALAFVATRLMRERAPIQK